MVEEIKKSVEQGSSDNFLVNEEELHVMPKKFVIQNPKKKDSGAKGILVFFISFFVLLLAGLGFGYYWFQQKNKPKTENVNIVDNNNQVVVNQNNNQNNTNANQNSNTNTNQNNNQNANVNINNNSNTNTNTNTNENPPSIVVDTDQDALMDLEEQTYKTDVQLADTDKDGYKDGDEVRNLYDPLATNQKLIDSGLVIRYTNDLYGYEVFSPRGWLVKAIDDSRRKIEFIPDNAVGELLRIEAMDNMDNKTLMDWQKVLFGTQIMENFQVAQTPALRSLDKKQVLVVKGNYYYLLTYEGTQNNFMTTFDMFLKSFQFVSKP